MSATRNVGILAAAFAVAAQLSFAQVTTTGIHGVVRDPSGATIPNASLKLRDMATGIEKAGAANSEGTFVFVNLVAGTYSLTASAPGFQNKMLDNLVVDTGRTTDISVQMAVGSTTESVEVSAAMAQLETTTNEVGTTINNKAIQDLPYASRDALQFSLLMAGNAAANDPSGRNSTFNNLPNASLSITLDGMDNNSERFKSGGTSFYSFAPMRIDAIEELTVSTAGLGSDASGMGAMNMRFTTRRGTDQYHFSAGEQFANEDLNSNSFFKNLLGQPISKTRQNNPYGSIGGPLVPFVPALKHKLFFFAYFEAQPQPGSTTLNTTVLNADAQKGIFDYIGTDNQPHSVNLLQVAAQNGQPSTVDPTIASIFGVINGSQAKATNFVGITGQPYWQTMYWTQGTNTLYLFPTARVDYQITPKVAWHGTWNLRYENISGSAPPYPGLDQYAFTNGYKITTYVASNAVDWTITPHMINSAMIGIQSNGEFFYQGSDPHQWAPYGNRRFTFPTASNGSGLIASPIPSTLPFIRNNPVYQFKDDLNWLKGKHTILMGGIVKHSSFYETSYGSAGVPGYTMGIASADPIGATLQAALPAINTQNGDLTNAQALYAVLTGRLTGISASTNVDEHSHQFAEFQPVTQRFAFTYGGLYIEDSYRVTPNFTLNYGFRWEMDGPIQSTNGIDGSPTADSFYGPSTGLFQPGVLNGNLNPSLVQLNVPYKSSLVNPAPNFGFAWNPNGSGILGKLLGRNKTVLRGGYSISYYNEGMNAISNVLSGNRGSSQSIAATAGGPGFPYGGVSLSSPAPPLTVTPATWGYPIPLSNYALVNPPGLYYVNPGLKSPYVQSWNFGIQRELPSRVVLEVRYLGNKSTHLWHYQNVNEVNIFENGFLPQFIQAQQNLNVNVANGKGNTFINNGLPGQAAIPIFDTAFGANGTNPALATGSGYASSTFITDLQQGLAGTLAGSLASTSSPTYYCRLVGSKFGPCAAQGYTANTPYPINFFTPNPYAGSLNYQDDNGNTNYNALQVEARKNLTHGLSGTVNFTYSHGLGNMLNASDQTATYQWFTMRNGNLSYGPSPFDHRFALNGFWTYDLPFGKGRAIPLTNGVLDRVLGGWTLGGIEQIATGSVFLLSSARGTVNTFNTGSGQVGSGVVLGSGLTANQLRTDLTTIPNMNKVVNGALISNVGSIVQTNGQPNSAYYGPAATPGAFGDFIYMYGRPTFSLHMSLDKAVRIREHLTMGFRLEALNFLNHPFFNIGNTSPTSTSFGQVSSTYAASGSSSYNRVVLLRAYMSW
ncbi:MAG TPA: carboxypeptidase-like regulatory domain-containing protein [Bryobacteraceae bacterium]|nr:carboxypeptidase-like regulatory domain-containing protein [Bryobacteraceae bacterium]